MLTVAVTLLVALGPGAALGYAVPSGPSRWAVWASAPVLTMGLASIGLAWLNALGLPSGAWAVLGVEIAVVLIAVGVGRWCDRREDVPRAGRASLRLELRARWVDLVALAVPTVLFLAVAEAMLGGFRYPPGWDGENHGYLTRAILDTGSTDVVRVCTDGTSGAPASCHFYPLAMDVAWAQTVAVSNGLVSTSMLTWAIVIAPLGLLVALYAAVRMLGGSAVVAGCVALGPAVLGPLWVGVMAGRVPEEAAPGFSVAVGVLAALAVRGWYPVRLGLLAGLGMAGILISHTYDVLFAGTVAVALSCAGPLVARAQDGAAGLARASVVGAMPSKVPARRQILLALGAAALAGLFTVGPYGSSLLGANGERASTKPQNVGDLAGAWRFWVTDFRRYSTFGFPAPGDNALWPNLTLVHLATRIAVVAIIVSPLGLVIPRLRWARPWLGLFVLWTAVGIWTSYSDDAVATSLAGLWYGGSERLRVMVLPIYATVVVAGICVIALGLQWLVGRVFGRLGKRGGTRATPAPGWTRAIGPATAAVVVVGLVAVGLQVHRDPALPLRRDLAERTATTASYPRVFRWLAAHTTSGQVVAADRNVEFMVWSYADHGTGLLFGIPPLIAASKPNAAARDAVWDWLVGNPGATPSGCDVRRFDVAYLVVGTKKMPGYASQYDPARIAASPNLALALRDGGVTVYTVTDAARAC